MRILHTEVINMLTWTQKESALLADLKTQEQLCADKYGQYAERANDPELKGIFTTIQQAEQSHLQTVETLLSGQMPAQGKGKKAQQKAAKPVAWEVPTGEALQQAMEEDKFLCQDAICTEKEVSGAYNVSIFEFRDPQVRQLLHGIQGAEQQHGEMLWTYMARNQMVQAQ